MMNCNLLRELDLVDRLVHLMHVKHWLIDQYSMSVEHQLVNVEYSMEDVQINYEEIDDHNDVDEWNYFEQEDYNRVLHASVVHLVVVSLRYVRRFVHHLYHYELQHCK